MINCSKHPLSRACFLVSLGMHTIDRHGFAPLCPPVILILARRSNDSKWTPSWRTRRRLYPPTAREGERTSRRVPCCASSRRSDYYILWFSRLVFGELVKVFYLAAKIRLCCIMCNLLLLVSGTQYRQIVLSNSRFCITRHAKRDPDLHSLVPVWRSRLDDGFYPMEHSRLAGFAAGVTGRVVRSWTREFVVNRRFKTRVVQDTEAE